MKSVKLLKKDITTGRIKVFNNINGLVQITEQEELERLEVNPFYWEGEGESVLMEFKCNIHESSNGKKVNYKILENTALQMVLLQNNCVDRVKGGKARYSHISYIKNRLLTS